MSLVAEDVREDGERYVHEAMASTLPRGGGFQTCPLEIEVHRSGCSSLSTALTSQPNWKSQPFIALLKIGTCVPSLCCTSSFMGSLQLRCRMQTRRAATTCDHTSDQMALLRSSLKCLICTVSRSLLSLTWSTSEPWSVRSVGRAGATTPVRFLFGRYEPMVLYNLTPVCFFGDMRKVVNAHAPKKIRGNQASQLHVHDTLQHSSLHTLRVDTS